MPVYPEYSCLMYLHTKKKKKKIKESSTIDCIPTFVMYIMCKQHFLYPNFFFFPNLLNYYTYTIKYKSIKEYRQLYEINLFSYRYNVNHLFLNNNEYNDMIINLTDFASLLHNVPFEYPFSFFFFSLSFIAMKQ